MDLATGRCVETPIANRKRRAAHVPWDQPEDRPPIGRRSRCHVGLVGAVVGGPDTTQGSDAVNVSRGGSSGEQRCAACDHERRDHCPGSSARVGPRLHSVRLPSSGLTRRSTHRTREEFALSLSPACDTAASASMRHSRAYDAAIAARPLRRLTGRMSRSAWNFAPGDRVSDYLERVRRRPPAPRSRRACERSWWGRRRLAATPRTSLVRSRWPVDLAQTGFGFEHACGGPAQAHVAVLPALDVAADAPDGVDHWLAGTRPGERALEAAVHPKADDGERLLEALAQ